MKNGIENVNSYSECANRTALYKSREYPFLLLAEEAGEVLGKINKVSRKSGMPVGQVITEARLDSNEQLKADLIKELGDVAWAFVECCRQLDVPPSVVFQMNIDKLSDRAERGVINGAGDNR